jgi:hypothetical protein
MVQARAIPPGAYFHCAQGFGTQILAGLLDSLVRVSRRVVCHHFASILSVGVAGPPDRPRAAAQSARLSAPRPERATGGPCALQSSVQARASREAITPPPRRRPPSPRLLPARQTDAGPGPAKCTAQGAADLRATKTGGKRFPFDNFTSCLTLFSKCFSSFPHGTCSLSVSRRYLALDGIYHPFWSAFPSKPTRGKRLAVGQAPDHTRDSHPL